MIRLSLTAQGAAAILSGVRHKRSPQQILYWALLTAVQRAVILTVSGRHRSVIYLARWYQSRDYERVNNTATADFAKNILAQAISGEIDGVTNGFLLKTFKRVLLQESTTLSLKARLIHTVKVCDASKASCLC